MIDILIPVKPFSKQRPRFAGGRVYTPKETQIAEREIAYLVKMHMAENHICITSNPVRIDIAFYFQTNVAQKFKKIYTKKPDVDNLAKTVLDALNQICYVDDKQVCVLTCKKLYDENYGIRVKIQELEEE